MNIPLVQGSHRSFNYKREAKIATMCLAATGLVIAGLVHFLASNAYTAFVENNLRTLIETAIFGTALFFVFYGNLLYQICLIGYYKRRDAYKPASRDALEQVYSRTDAPSLSVLIPSYKEERNVNFQTMMSAALAEYPGKNVILLVDDPYRPKALADMVKLEDTRKIPGELQAMFAAPSAIYSAELDAFKTRACVMLNGLAELARLADHYTDVAAWLHNIAADYMGKNTLEMLPYADRFFVEAILNAPARQHLAQAQLLRDMAAEGNAPSEAFLMRHYARLAGLFSVSFSSFERKKYANLCHEANKAMNLNSYISLVGKSWKEVEQENGDLHLVQCDAAEASFTIPAADYINTIDADSLMTADYALRLIELMEQPDNHRLAVVQSPCSSFPGCPKSLERTAGACIDIQFLTHQGYTYWGASFWVGANAMLRYRALEEIKEIRIENGHPVSIYIQDRTVIEDTESTIDLVHKGWKLYNYPIRMTFSATPPDFGSLLIQRRRWSNGGLIILPKLFRYTANAPKNRMLAKEFFMRFHYLASTTTGCVAAWLFLLYPFGELFSTAWLPMAVVPFLLLHIRDLRNSGYHASDALRICAMNLMLVPIVTGGVLKSFQQILTGKKIPFSRTPKIPGRTSAPAMYCVFALLMPLAFIGIAINQFSIGHTSQGMFALLNFGFLAYALVHYIGIKAAFEDIMASLPAHWRRRPQAEIIPLNAPVSPSPVPAMVKQA